MILDTHDCFYVTSLTTLNFFLYIIESDASFLRTKPPGILVLYEP